MAEPQLKWGIGATDTSKGAFQSFTQNVRRSQADIRQLGLTSDTTFRKFNRSISESSLHVGRLASGIRNLLPILAAGIGAQFLKQALENIGALNDAAQKAGIKVSALQKLTAAGVGTSTSQDSFVGALAKFNKVLGESELKGGGLSRFFEANGVLLRDQNGQMRDSVDLFIELGDLVKNAADEQSRTVIATAALGRAGADMIPFFMQGSEAIHKMMDDSERMGGIWSDELVKAADEVGDKWARAAHTWAAVWQGKIAEIAVAFDLLVTKQENLTDAELQYQRQQILHKEYGFKADHLDPGRRARELAVIDAQIAQREAARRQLTKRDYGMFPETNVTKVTKDILEAGKAETESHKLSTAATNEHREAAKRLTDELRVQAEMQKKLADSMDVFRDDAKAGLHDVFDILKDGKIELKEIGDLLTSIGSKLVNRGLDKFVDSMFGASGTTDPGIIGREFTGLFGARPTMTFPGLGDAVQRNPFDTMRGTAGGTYPIDPHTGKVLPGLGHSIYVPGLTPSAPNRGSSYSGVSGLTQSGIPLLDLIGKAEGTDKGRGYNETLAYGRFTGGNRNLTGMSLDQIDDLQKMMLDNPKNKFNSSALGRYQITRRTLLGERDKLGLSGDDLFSPRLQDSVALDLAGRRGPNVGGLRNEWAGLNNEHGSTILTAFNKSSAQIAQNFTSQMAKANTDVAGNFGSSITSALGGLGGGKTQAGGGGGFGSIFGSILSLFGGAFAEGGHLGAGKWGVAGENGPEVIRGPADIIPSDAGGGARVRMGSTTIHIHGNPDQKTIAMIDRRMSENNAAQRLALSKSVGALNSSFALQRGF